MTFYEHSMVGINGALAAGLHRRHGWQIVALAGAAAMLPDLDGLTILFGFRCYADAHRVWLHNLLFAALAAAVLAAATYYTNVLSAAQQWLASRSSLFADRPDSGVDERRWPRPGSFPLPLAASVLACYSHLLMDVCYSTGNGLAAWGVPLLWPFSAATFTCSSVRWGDVGATIILAASMFAMLRWSKRVQPIAAASLLAVAAYIGFRAL